MPCLDEHADSIKKEVGLTRRVKGAKLGKHSPGLYIV